MEALRQRLQDLFTGTQVATTDQVATALLIDGHPNAMVRAIKNRAKRLGIDLEHIGYNAWILNR